MWAKERSSGNTTISFDQKEFHLVVFFFFFSIDFVGIVITIFIVLPCKKN
jgi:hypothetical protein